MSVGGMTILRCRVNFFCASIFSLAGLLASLPSAAVDLGDKNILLLRAALNSVWGEYIFSAHNPTANAQAATLTLLLPREKTDFRANEGAMDSELQLNSDGEVVLSKEFPAGTTVFSILFKSSADKGKAILSFTAPHQITDLVLMYEHSLQVEPQAGNWEHKHIAALPHKDYRTLQNSEPIRAGQKFSLLVSDVPTDRQQLHLYALGFAVILILLAAIGTAVSMPGMRSDILRTSNKYRIKAK